MKDYDSIELGFVFEEPPSQQAHETLFSMFYNQGDGSKGEKHHEIHYRDGDHRSTIDADNEEAAEIMTTASMCHVSLSTGHSNIDHTIEVGFDNSGMGLLATSPYHHLSLTTWIYSLEDPKKEALDTVKNRRMRYVRGLAEMAQIFGPLWGFGRRGGLAVGEDETIEDLATRTKPPLYEYNVFRAETVEAIGREQVLSAPAYYVEELDWGGVFIAVTEPPKQCGHEGQQCKEVADQLGLSLAKTERYH
ncbi:hypothetical protein [Haloarcula sp. CBA1127]|uniref:hypothetical protein n=1 Tax=Haloarcula sp. CBA1127 TaxID=1765055 RepID=UPI000AE46679|nr:hypothetical protein [Haloarcula sp. CBA1127]